MGVGQKDVNLKFLQDGSDFVVDNHIFGIDGRLAIEDKLQDFAHGRRVEVWAEDVIVEAVEAIAVASRGKDGSEQLGALSQDQLIDLH